MNINLLQPLNNTISLLSLLFFFFSDRFLPFISIFRGLKSLLRLTASRGKEKRRKINTMKLEL